MQHKYQTHVLLSIAVFSLIVFIAALPVAAQEEPPCYALPECYEPPPPQPTPGSPTTGSSSSPIWSGYSDGRLSPAMDEYYSVWCVDTFLEIWRGVPSPALLQLVPIWLLEDIPPNGGTETIPNYGMTPFTITRNGDLLTISGNYGNLQPQPGSKSFSLSDCISSDGHTAAQRGSGSPAQSNFAMVTTTHCYGRNSVQVQRGLVPPDQICDDNPNHGITTGLN